MEAPINKILPYSVVDGPGNRVSVFFQGCNIHCAYCHNPETQNLCNGCGLCVRHCPAGALREENGVVTWDAGSCCGCDTCIAVCPRSASPKVRTMTPQAVFEKVCESIPFIRGITVSGGECSLYPDFLRELFALAHTRNLSCLMDSNGMTDFAALPELMAVCDGVMLDVKAWDARVYHRLTGADNDIVKKNLSYLAHAGKLAELRIVVVPDRVDAEACLAGIAQSLSPAQRAAVPLKLIRFRHFGVRGELSGAPAPSEERMQTLRREASRWGFEKIMIL